MPTYSFDQFLKLGGVDPNDPEQVKGVTVGSVNSMPINPKKNILETASKVAGFTGGNIIARGLGEALAQGETKRTLDQIQIGQGKQQQLLLEAIKKNKAEGKDTSRLEDSLRMLTGSIGETGGNAEKLLNPSEITTKQVLGDVLQLGTTLAGVGSLPGVKQAVTQGTGFVKGAIEGSKAAAKSGAMFGASSGVAQGLKENKDLTGVAKSGLTGLLGGGITGGILGGLLGGVSGSIKKLPNKNYREYILGAQEDAGSRTLLSDTVKEKSTDPIFKGLIKEAQKQGYSDRDINFLATVSDTDKPTLQKMFDLTVKAQKDPRQITRAADVLGENVSRQVKQVVKLNQKAGKAVDATAKLLKGQAVDTTSLKASILSKLENAAIKLNDDGTLDFNQSVFKNTPSIQKELQKVIASVPDGSDAYQLHIFKKSLDEILDFGTSGEGLKGAAANILKSFRNSADEVLDKGFADYNEANSFFRLTKEYLDEASSIAGKKVDLNSKEGALAFGQALRSAFSNNKSRGNTLKFIEDTHLLSKQLGLSDAEQNLLDQALYVNILEDIFGSEATTGLAGEVTKAINKVKRVVDVVRNPVSGALDYAADFIEKKQNITPEAKQKILSLFIK